MTPQPPPAYRWCDRQEQFLAIEVCEKYSRQKPHCYRCYHAWQQARRQPLLPLEMPDPRDQGR